MDKESFKVLAILVGYFLLLNLMWYVADGFAAWTQTADPILASVAYMLTNLDHLAVIFSLTYFRRFRGFVASLFVVSSFDIASFAHFIQMNGALPTDPSTFMGLDTQLYRMLYPNFPLGTYGLYVLSAFLLFLGAALLLAHRPFINTVRKISGVRI